MKLYKPSPIGESIDLRMTYEEAYDLMNDLHESLQAIDNGRTVCRKHCRLDGFMWPSYLDIVVEKV